MSGDEGVGGRGAERSHPPTSVLLPTVRHVHVIDQVAAQLGPADELLVICDTEDDPVARQREQLPAGAHLLVAGEPEGCSGKANAIAAGMDAAHERLVWTDDDFEHPPEWLAGLQRDYEERGPTTELPFFRGLDPLAVLLEPATAFTGTVGVYFGDRAWGGAVVFERSDLREDEAALLEELRSTVSDDALLAEHLDLDPVRRVRTIPAGGSMRDSLERQVRFSAIARQHAPIAAWTMGFLLLGVAALLVVFPLIAGTLTTLLAVGAYAWLGIRRWTAVLMVPSLLLLTPVGWYAAARRTFVWGGRRYRYRSKFDVEVLPVGSDRTR